LVAQRFTPLRVRAIIATGSAIVLTASYTLKANSVAETKADDEVPICPKADYLFPVDKLRYPTNSNKEQIVLIACGSFNPITNMHLRLFEMSKDYFEENGFEVLGGYLSPVSSGYGKAGLLTNQQRLDMSRLGVASSDWLMVDDWETTFPSWTRTYLVLKHFSKELNKNNKGKPIRTALVCGSDLLDSFSTPGLWSPEDVKGIMKEHGLACVTREGSNPESIVWNNDLLYNLKSDIHVIRQYIPNDVSSTRVRRALTRGLSVRYILPDRVLEYIKYNKLYK